MAKLFWNCKTCRHSCVMSCAGGGRPTLSSSYGFRRYRRCSLAGAGLAGGVGTRDYHGEVKWFDSCGYYEFAIFSGAAFVGYDLSEEISRIKAQRN